MRKERLQSVEIQNEAVRTQGSDPRAVGTDQSTLTQMPTLELVQSTQTQLSTQEPENKCGNLPIRVSLYTPN